MQKPADVWLHTCIQRFDRDAKWTCIGMSTGLTCGIKFIVIAGVCMVNLKGSDVDNDRDNKAQLRSHVDGFYYEILLSAS